MAYSTINKIDSHYIGVTYSGNSTAGRNLTDVGFAPDMVWYKCRSHNEHNRFVNSTEADAQSQILNSNGGMGSDPQGITGFLSNGYTLGSTDHSNATGKTYVSWNFLLGGTAPAITYTVKVVSDSGNKYRFDDFGTSAVTLDLQEGGTYTFDQADSSNSGHPLRFYTASDKSGGEYTTGVTTNGTPGSSGAYTRITVASGAATLYYQCSSHAGMGGQANTNSTHGSSNFDGNIQSTVTANTNLGISLVRYDGSGSASTTVGHGLGTALDAVIVKDRDGAEGWHTHFEKLADGENYRLNESHGQYSKDSQFSYGVVDCNEASTSTFKFLGTGSNVNNVNESSRTYTAICFSNRTGLLMAGEYKGNNSTNGTFVYTGFKPKWVLIKHNGSSNWTINDTVRDPVNVNNLRLFPNQNVAENSGSNSMDMLSNGFKLKSTDGGNNGNNDEYHFIAIGQPLVGGSNNIPATAR